MLEFAAWYVLILAALELLIRPFAIGKKVEVTAFATVLNILMFPFYVLLCGTALGWF